MQKENVSLDKKKHISYSEFSNWIKCAHKHKVFYVDRSVSGQSTKFTVFGTAIHYVLEQILLHRKADKQYNNEYVDFFYKFNEELKNNKVELSEEDKFELSEQAKTLCPIISQSLIKEFGSNYEVIGVEEQLYEPLDNSDYNFKGYIDAVIKSNDKYYILDAKSCSWGWTATKKTDKITTYQLTFYKNFFARKYKIPLKNIETYFFLLKRTAKPDNNVEFVRATSGDKKISNALKLLEKTLLNIKNKIYVKNLLHCEQCELWHTEWCKHVYYK